MQYSILSATILLALSALCPVQTAPTGPTCQPTITPQQLLAIAPGSATCASGSPECRTAQQAAGPIARSFARYGIYAPHLQAALVSTIVLESGEFKYSRNKVPGRPGQGTRNMQMPPFNLQYAQSLPDIADKVAGKAPADVLDLILANDDYDFGSAAWYVTSQAACKPALGLLNGGNGEAAFTSYLTDCLGTTVTSERTAYHMKAMAQFGSGGASNASPAPASVAAPAPSAAPYQSGPASQHGGC